MSISSNNSILPHNPNFAIGNSYNNVGLPGPQSKFKVGDMVYAISRPSVIGRVTHVHADIVRIEDYWSFMEHDLEFCNPGAVCPVVESLQKKCTCGVHKTYGVGFTGHSTWCDLYETK